MAEKVVIAAKMPEARQKCSNSCKQNPSYNFSGSSTDRILQLQRTTGNQAVQRLIKSRSLQAKLRIGQPNDIHEQEADRVAEQVMKMPDPVLQRKCTKCEENEKNILQTKELQRRVLITQDQDLPPLVQEVLSSPGKPLDPVTRAFMERRFGYDFSKVRVHEGAAAEQSSRDINADAYTVGNNIVFEKGRFAPGTRVGKLLIAHELTHVVQQRMDRKISSGSARIQRQPNLSVHSTPDIAGPTISLEKWSSDVESSYRRAGLLEEANAVHKCREEGACDKVLTGSEAWQIFSSGRISAGFSAATKGAAGVPFIAGTAASKAAVAESAVTRTALERAAARWGTAALVEGGAAASGGAAGAVTIAAPAVLGAAYITVAIASLVSWGSFQAELKKQGYVVLPSPLAVCIGSCHQPATPTFRSRPPWPQDFTGPLPRPLEPRPLSDADWYAIEDWLRPEASRKKSNPQPTPQPSPSPQPQPQPKSRKCSNKLVETLNKKMHESCNKERSCSKQVDTCKSAIAKVAAGYGCVRERTELQQKCFSKGDPGYEEHMKMIAEASAALRRCREVESDKCK